MISSGSIWVMRGSGSSSPAADQAHQPIDSHSGDDIDVIVDGRKRRLGELGKLDVVIAHDGQVLGNAHLVLVAPVQRAESQRIVVAEHGGGSVFDPLISVSSAKKPCVA